MADVHSPEQRSRNMARIRSGDTKPELIVRSLVHRMGARFRLRVKTLPGTPDLVFPGRRKVIFVHGCFWHCHDCRYGQVTLFVFQFADAADASGSPDQQLPGKVRNIF